MKIKEVKQLLEIFDDEEEFEVKVNGKVFPIITLDYKQKLRFSDGSNCIMNPTDNMYININKYLKDKKNEKDN